MAKEIVAMILAGGRGSRLYALTQKTAKPAVSFGGKYRIVDFPLSNCVNSDIDTVGIATQYQPQKLNEYIGNGQPWDLDRLHGGVHTLPPYEQANGTDWYKGTANAIYQNIGFIDSYDPEYVIILSGDQICKQDYADFLRFHKEKGAEFSVAVMEVDWKEASRFGLMVADETLLPHSASVMSSTRRTETPARYISMRASSTLLSRRRYRSMMAVSKEIPLSLGILSVTSPEVVVRLRL